MIKNYLKIAFRNLIRHKAYSAINIAGLAIGMASSILILLWVQNELSYDRFHENANQLYRISCSLNDFKAAVNPAGMPGGLKAKMPEIKAFVRLSKPATLLVENGIRKFEEKKVFYADSNFLDVFTFPLIAGNKAVAMKRPDAILLSASMAKKYFGNEDAIGKTLRINNGENMAVTGVLADAPSNSHLQFDFIIPLSAIAHSDGDLVRNVWDNFNYYSYVLLDKNVSASKASLEKLNQRICAIYKEHQPGGLDTRFQLQPLTAIHLQNDLQIDLPGHGNRQYINIFFVVAVFILIVACINFMNLATARSARRAKEVGLRKVVGALRGQLIGQFLGESMLISFFALLLAILIVVLMLPLFNSLSDKQLSIHLLEGKILFTLAGIALVTGIVSGIYPALFLSGFRPVKVLKGNLKSLGGNLVFRNGLVITQFIVSIVLLVGTAVIYNQLQFIKHRNPGFQKANLLYIPMQGELWQRKKQLRTAMEANPLTANYTLISELPVNIVAGTVEADWEGKDKRQQIVIPSLNVTENFLQTFGMELLRGRGFSKEFLADSNSFVINEKAVQVMGMTVDNAVGKPLSFGGDRGTIIGVVKDFNFKPVQIAIEPLVLRTNRWGGYVMVRTQPGQTEATIAKLASITKELNPAYPFSYNFLDQDIDNQYRGDQQMGKIFNLFAILAIFISSLGLYGLSAFMAQQRTKEIGVRKVLGASVTNIVLLLSVGFTRLILIATVVAIPIAWYGVNSWLQTFAYHISINWLLFLLAPLAALIIAWITVSYESLKAAVSNPVKSLRTE